ncbi:TniQ family protein [Streptomyces sp. QL37]|uniref:TniQ family protein n=1 Tax=Streptomyces sp. QL37 TaxID=2093747 RepID=UPI001374CA53|nr:TniQ family protein [Streptomyces sp. QL37]
MRLIAGESTGSFVTRLAALNDMPVVELMERIGDGERPMPVQSTEVYLNASALQRLAVMSGSSVSGLQRALPHLQAHHLLDDGSGPAWRWPQWQPRGPLFLVRACDLCAQARRRPSDVYLVSVTRWRVCARHRRWLDNLREADTTWLSLARLPQVVQAHQKRVALERRLGAGGRALFADALHIAALWWNVPALSPPAWAARRRMLTEPAGSDLRIAPLVSYPETVRLAGALASRERRRLRGTWDAGDDQAWSTLTSGLLREWEMPEPAFLALDWWMDQHSIPAPALREERPSRGRWRRLPAPLPHTAAPSDTHLEQLTCLPWRFGDEPSMPDAARLWSVSGQA